MPMILALQQKRPRLQVIRAIMVENVKAVVVLIYLVEIAIATELVESQPRLFITFTSQRVAIETHSKLVKGLVRCSRRA